MKNIIFGSLLGGLIGFSVGFFVGELNGTDKQLEEVQAELKRSEADFQKNLDLYMRTKQELSDLIAENTEAIMNINDTKYEA